MIYFLLLPLFVLVINSYKENYDKIDNKLQELDTTNYDDNW